MASLLTATLLPSRRSMSVVAAITCTRTCFGCFLRLGSPASGALPPMYEWRNALWGGGLHTNTSALRSTDLINQYSALQAKWHVRRSGPFPTHRIWNIYTKTLSLRDKNKTNPTKIEETVTQHSNRHDGAVHSIRPLLLT